MTEDNRCKLWALIKEAGDCLLCQRDTVVHSSYADNLQFIKNKPHKDSTKTLTKLETRLETFAINQMVYSRGF